MEEKKERKKEKWPYPAERPETRRRKWKEKFRLPAAWLKYFPKTYLHTNNVFCKMPSRRVKLAGLFSWI